MKLFRMAVGRGLAGLLSSYVAVFYKEDSIVCSRFFASEIKLPSRLPCSLEKSDLSINSNAFGSRKALENS